MKVRQQIAIIGSGNVATHLAKAFYAKGIQISCICSRYKKNAERLASLVQAKSFDRLDQYDWDNELVIMAIKDDAIVKVLDTELLLNASVAHTSGSFDVMYMKDFCKDYGALYPFQSFRKEAAVEMKNVPCFVEGGSQAFVTELEALASLISKNVTILDSLSRKKLHISGVFINNFIYYILDKMKIYCGENDIDASLLMPLMQQTVDNALLRKDNLQTGPAKRGDVSVVNEHLSILEQVPELQKLYKTLSQLILDEFHEEIKL